MDQKYIIPAAAGLTTILIALLGWMGNLVVIGVNENSAENAAMRKQLSAMEARQATYLREVLARMDRQDARLVRMEGFIFERAAREEARRNKESSSWVTP